VFDNFKLLLIHGLKFQRDMFSKTGFHSKYVFKFELLYEKFVFEKEK
jgi:hypothetical protein